MSASYRDQMAITTYFLERLEIYLAGRSESECLDHLPGDKYHLGVLAPWQNTGDSMSQPDETDEGDKNAPNADSESSSGKSAPAAVTTPSGVGVSGEAAATDVDGGPDIGNQDGKQLTRGNI